MGGLVFDTTDEEPFLPHSVTRIRLQPDGVEFLMKHAPEIIPTLSREEILDKSKADGLSKALACLQAGWFCTQVMARAAQHLPICLLELTTLAHAFCMIVAYILWWGKPFEVQEPAIINAWPSNVTCRELLAYMSMRTPYRLPGIFSLPPAPDCQCFCHHHLFADPEGDGSTSVYSIKADDGHDEVVYKEGCPLCEGDLTEAHGMFVHIIFFVSSDLRKVAYVFFRDVRRWMLASRAVNHFGLDRHDTRLDLVRRTTDGAMLYYSTIPELERRLSKGLALAIIVAGYGGIHILAWQHTFPSDAQARVWHLSSIWITIVGVTGTIRIPLANIVLKYIKAKFKNRCPNCIQYLDTRQAEIHKKVFWYMLLLMYAVGSISIDVLCFIDFAHLPPEAFVDISWSKFVPHFS